MEGIVCVTYRCNAKCHMCNIWQYPTKPQEEIMPDIAEKIPFLKFVNITGGEPFIRDDIEEFVIRLKQKAERVVISTNGFFTDRVINLAKKHRDIGIRISLEGLPKANDELRGIKDGFDRGLRTLLELKHMGMKDIGFGITVSDKNAKDLLELYKLAVAMKVEFATAAVHNTFYFHKFDNKIEEKELVTGEFKKLVEELLRTKRVKNWFRAYFNWGLMNYTNGGKRFLPCRAGTDLFFINPDGKMYPCNAMDEVFGDLNENSFDTIWNGEQAGKIREKVANCDMNCWMIGSVAPAMKRDLFRVSKWVLKAKLFGIPKEFCECVEKKS
ncbi:MAG: radical SAM protein [Planctomycetota bacterium]